ncbi:MAG TPA: lysylphosphatidylglycerol synthase transmembrane domain-containing protein [Acidobacteriaceae bacterium]
MKNSRLWGVVVLLLLAAVVFVFRGRIHFDVHSFVAEVRQIDGRHVAAGVALILGCYWLRALRWALFLRPLRSDEAPKRVTALNVLGSQFIGFTAVALFGRLADLTRPYLVAKRTQLSVSSQIAVYTVERMFDLGSAALIFSGALAFMPKTPPMPHAEVIARVGRGSLLATLALAVFAVVLRVTGETIARFARVVFGAISAKLGESVAEKIRGFRDGLRVVTSVGEFAYALGLSLAMWMMIAMAYVQSVHAFRGTPQLAQMSFSQTMLLMGSSIAGSVIQLPIVGWFSQIGVTAAAMTGLFGVRVETATACGAVILAVCSLSVIPVGLIYAQFEQVSLKKVAEESAEAEK